MGLTGSVARPDVDGFVLAWVGSSGRGLEEVVEVLEWYLMLPVLGVRDADGCVVGGSGRLAVFGWFQVVWVGQIGCLTRLIEMFSM